MQPPWQRLPKEQRPRERPRHLAEHLAGCCRPRPHLLPRVYKYPMNLFEIWQQEPQAYQDLSQDNSQTTAKDLRKTRLTLRQLNKLRRMNDVRAVEYKDKLAKIRTQYAPAPAAPAV